MFTMDSKKSMTFAIDGFGRAAGAGLITGEATANGQIISRYKKLNAPNPHLWTYDYGAKWAANITDLDISHLDLEEFGADFSLIPSMDIRLIGTGFPFEGLKATTTAQLRATAGFEISNKIPEGERQRVTKYELMPFLIRSTLSSIQLVRSSHEADIQVEVENDSGTAGEDLEVVIKWRNIPRREDVINVYIHNDCWDSDVKHKVISQKQEFRSTSGSMTLNWKVPYDSSLSQLNFLGYDDFLGLEICASQKFFLSVVLEKDKISEYHSNEFTLLVNAVDGGYGVNSPSNGAVLYAGEQNSFAWNSEGYTYFSEGDAAVPAKLVNIENVSIVLYGAETDCIGSPLVDSLFQLFDPRWGCEESWVQISASTPNDGRELLTVPYKTLDGKDLQDFDEVHVSIIGVDNTNVYSRNKGTFIVKNGCPSMKRYRMAFHIEGQSDLTNIYTDFQTGFYFSVETDSSIDDIKYTMRKGYGVEDADWDASPILNHHVDLVICEADEVKFRAYEIDDITYQRLCCDFVGGDDDYGQWSKTPAEWVLGSDGSGDGVWSLKTNVANAFGGTEHRGHVPVRVEMTLLSENGMPVDGGQRRTTRLRKVDAMKSTQLRTAATIPVIPRPGGRRRLHHDECVTAYYHVESLLEMTKVTYTQPDVLEDYTEPILNFIGYDSIKMMTLYSSPEPPRIDVIPYTEYTLHNFEGFDCSKLRQPKDYWENLWEGFLLGDTSAIATVVGGGVVATGALGYAIWVLALGGAGCAGFKTVCGVKKSVVKERRTSEFEGENPMVEANHEERGDSLPPPLPPPPTEESGGFFGLKTFFAMFLRSDSTRARNSSLNRAMEMATKKGVTTKSGENV